MTALFDMGALSAALTKNPKEALLSLAQAALQGRIDVVRGSAEGATGPAHDTKREYMLVRLQIAAPLLQDVQAQANNDGFNLCRQLEEQKEGGFPESLTIEDTEGQRYCIVSMQGGDGGNVLVIERAR